MNLSKDEEVKKAILDAAKRVFQKWGLNKTTMQDIAEEAGKGKSTLYYYYKSKEEIFEAFVVEEQATLVKKTKEAISNIDSPRKKIARFIATILKYTKDTVSVYPLLVGEIKANRDFIENLINKISWEEKEIILDILRDGVKTGDFSFLEERELETAANAMLKLLRTLVHFIFSENSEEEIDIILRFTTNGI